MKQLEHLPGHYGILGMRERVKAVNGNIHIESRKKAGAAIHITIPIEKGATDEDE